MSFYARQVGGIFGGGGGGGGGVTSLNTETGDINLTSVDSSVTITPSGQTIDLAAPKGTVTAVSVATANGLAGTSSGGATPALTLSTTVNAPILSGNGTGISSATTTGTGTTAVLATAPTLSNPVVGTQTQGDASTKAASTAYVDTAVANAVAGVNPAVAVQAATTAAGDTSGFTYNNGASGIGATFTGSTNTAVTIDGFTFTALGQRLLVKNDTQSPSGAFNGIYYVTQVQTAILPPILTRALDYDTPSDINNTGAIPVVNGTANASTSWLLTSTVATVGTSPLTYTKFSINPSTILTNALTNTHIFVGNVSNVATDVAASGDLTLANTGAFTLATVNSNVGSFTNANITVNAKGLITAAANGSAGSGTVTSVSVVSANGLAGTVATATTTPAITLSTSITGILQGNGTAISAATTTGSGSVVLATSPTLVTPALGTPASGTLTNCTGLPNGGVTNTYAAKTGNYTVTTADRFINVDGSGGAFTITLPTAVGFTGVFSIKRTDSTIANAVTINTTSAQTMDGYASGAIKLFTQYESFTFYSNGANWNIEEHKSITPWTTYTQTINGSGSNPTKGTTTFDQGYWMRIGDSIYIRYEYNQTAAGSAGSGTYKFLLPNSLGMDSTKVKTVASGWNQSLGYGTGWDGTNFYACAVTALDANNFFLVNTVGTAIGSSTVSLGNTNARIGFEARVPITSWIE